MKLIKLTNKVLLEEEKNLVELYMDVFGGAPYWETYNPEDVVNDELRPLQEKDYLGFLLKSNDELIGFVWGYLASNLPQDITDQIQRSFDPEKTIYSAELGVRQDFRELGWGRRLVEEYLESVDNAGIELTLIRTSESDNDIAMNLYEKLGFRLENYTSEVSKGVDAEPAVRVWLARESQGE